MHLYVKENELSRKRIPKDHQSSWEAVLWYDEPRAISFSGFLLPALDSNCMATTLLEVRHRIMIMNLDSRSVKCLLSFFVASLVQMEPWVGALSPDINE